ncbi:MAG: hypothetical protein HIU84_06780 [Acidobacteria bacterium]|nr:hypothetical protein [Acidobacteriota bacterium]
MTTNKKRSERSTGTRTGLDALKAGLKRPVQDGSVSDIEGVKSGQSRIVSCSLRGPAKPYPRISKQGKLQISTGAVVWTPKYSLRRRGIEIAQRFAKMSVRDPGRAEWNVKKGGTALGLIPLPKFQVLVCEDGGENYEFTVPLEDLALVQLAMRGGLDS